MTDRQTLYDMCKLHENHILLEWDTRMNIYNHENKSWELFCDLEQRAFLYVIQIQKAIKENADISNTRSFKKKFYMEKDNISDRLEEIICKYTQHQGVNIH